MGRPYYSAAFKWKVVQEYKKEGRVLAKMTQKYGVHHTSVKKWEQLVRKEGKKGLESQNKVNNYPKKLKQAAIADYHSGNYSLREVTLKHGISNASVLRKWLKHYNRHRDFQTLVKERSISMAKGRKTTLEERIEIVRSALYNDKDYQVTGAIYGVSYQQVYQWVRKYEEGGWDFLQDRRGNPKAEAALTKEEKIKREMREIEKQNERLRAEVAFLKKLKRME